MDITIKVRVRCGGCYERYGDGFARIDDGHITNDVELEPGWTTEDRAGYGEGVRRVARCPDCSKKEAGRAAATKRGKR